MRIINFGQCPEVLFNKKHKENYLPQTEKGRDKGDDVEDFGSGGRPGAEQPGMHLSEAKRL